MKKISWINYSEYEKSPEKHHLEYWDKILRIRNCLDGNENSAEILAKYFDICKKYIEEHDLESDEECILLPIITRVIRCDKKWKHGEFNPSKILSVYRNKKTKVKSKFFNEIQLHQIDSEAQAVRETADFFTINKEKY